MEVNETNPDVLKKNYHARALAYLGDAVYEVYVREYLVRLGYTNADKLNKESHKFVTAAAQSHIAKELLPHLDERETDIFKHGRNLGHSHTARNIDPIEYRVATGIEVLFGELFLEGKSDRLSEIFKIITETVE